MKEPGLYKIIMRSNKKEAAKFQEWVCDEVLPSIRKTGKYKKTGHPKFKRLTFRIETEADLHAKVVNLLKNQYPDSLFVATLGENQDTPFKRLKSYRMGYLKGSPDLIINNQHKHFSGFAIEFKSPTGKGVLSKAQSEMMGKYDINNYKTLITNDYDECVVQIVAYMMDTRIRCKYCPRKFKNGTTLGNHCEFIHRK